MNGEDAVGMGILFDLELERAIRIVNSDANQPRINDPRFFLRYDLSFFVYLASKAGKAAKKVVLEVASQFFLV